MFAPLTPRSAALASIIPSLLALMKNLLDDRVKL